MRFTKARYGLSFGGNVIVLLCSDPGLNFANIEIKFAARRKIYLDIMLDFERWQAEIIGTTRFAQKKEIAARLLLEIPKLFPSFSVEPFDLATFMAERS